jgi:L-threonylcarbamoyladenylate synthase
MEVLTPRNDPLEAAARLFAAMRRLDALNLDLIVAEPPPPSGLGAAIIDRLRKAAAPR